MRRPEVLFFIAVILGVVVGKLIKNFKVGMFLGLLLGALLAFGAGRSIKRKDE
jgi:F0F1-type ATP synthase assembly protein I